MNESEKLSEIKWRHERDRTFYEDIEWLIEQTEKARLYETALKEISIIHNYDGFKAKDIARIVLDD